MNAGKLLAVWTLILTIGAASEARAEDRVDFNRDVRPLLSDHCFQCHGPDAEKREAELRLDNKRDAFAKRDGKTVLRPGDASSSELFRRVSSNDDDVRMPPPETERRLTKEQIETLRRWIEQGAEWTAHWSFVPPQRRTPPDSPDSAWARTAVDRFVLARLRTVGLGVSPEAKRTTLIRRVTLDLTGLPPTPAEVDAYLRDKSPDAYERVVDRLLASPRYGEHLTARWLNAARYADTSGYQNDGPRQMWRWRDWVIDALNSGMTFDRFTIEQLAGDLLDKPTLDQRIATGFNRNHRGNAEGGIIPEEYAVEYVVDRVDTTATVWMGLTIGCARCHDHKYDPIAQREFYRIFAYFNNVPEHGRAIKEGNSPPFIKAPTREQRRRLGQLNRRVSATRQRMKGLGRRIADAQREWEQTLQQQGPLQFTITDGQVVHAALDQADKTGKTIDGEMEFVPGRIGRAASFDGKRFLDLGEVKGTNFGYFDKFSISAWVYPQAGGGVIVSRMTDKPRGDGYYLSLVKGKVQVNLVKRWLDDSVRVESETSLPTDRWTHLTAVYDGTRLAKGIRLFVNGEPVPLKANLDYINQTFTAAKAPLRIGGGSGPKGRFHGTIDDVRVYNRALSHVEARVLGSAEPLAQLAAIPRARRTRSQATKLRQAFLERFAPQNMRSAFLAARKAGRERAQFFENLPTVMVMQELPKPRETNVLIRGQYDKPGARVTPGVPASLPSLPPGAPNNRLGFARWLVGRNHPLTSRVIVNRYWQMFFGQGLVRSVEDFGSQGERPSHPDLLDWMATEFIRLDWDIKALQKMIVMSATYRQSSRVTPDRLTKDPGNRWLSRGPRVRLSAEAIRDQALAVSGLLNERLGGPSTRPYQPAGLWKEIATVGDYVQDHGADLYRRSLYIYWKRTVAPPTMMNFDASAREMCTVRESRTNTPLQALTLTNEVSFVEAARVFAQNVMRRGGSVDDRLIDAFRRVLARSPKARELTILRTGYEAQLKAYRAFPDEAKKLISVGEYPADESLDATELAALTTITSLVLNLNEAVTKQ